MSSRSESRRDQRYQMNIRMIHESDWERRVSVSLIHSWWADFDFGWSSACSAALKAAFRCGSAPEVPQGPKPDTRHQRVCGPEGLLHSLTERRIVQPSEFGGKTLKGDVADCLLCPNSTKR